MNQRKQDERVADKWGHQLRFYTKISGICNLKYSANKVTTMYLLFSFLGLCSFNDLLCQYSIEMMSCIYDSTPWKFTFSHAFQKDNSQKQPTWPEKPNHINRSATGELLEPLAVKMHQFIDMYTKMS